MNLDVISDTLSEVGTISMGSAATALSTLLSRRVDITAPEVEITLAGNIKEGMPVPIVMVNVQYQKGFTGENLLLVKEEDASRIAAVMMGMDPHDLSGELGEMELSAISEAMNQMMGMASTALSDLFGRMIDISPPEMTRINLAEDAPPPGQFQAEDQIALVRFRLSIEDLLESTMAQVIPLPFARQMTEHLMASVEGSPAPSEMLASAGPGAVDRNLQLSSPASRRQEGSGLDVGPLGLLADIPIRLKVILGKASVPLKEVLDLSDGSVVELNRIAGEPVEIMAGDHLVGWGQVVTVGEQFGLRIVGLNQTGIAMVNGHSSGDRGG